MNLASLYFALLFFAVKAHAIKIGYLPFFGEENDDVDFFDAVEVLIETSGAINPTCKNHSLFYIQELKKFKLWASDMFDSSSKFSTGNLHGSTYDLGNYDQCVRVIVPNEFGEFSGRPCMAKFTVNAPKKYRKKKVDFMGDYRDFYNMSMLDKIFIPVGNPSKVARNEFYYTYCIPSSCTNEDFQNILDEFINLNKVNEFKISVQVEKRTCELSSQFQFDVYDYAFMAFVGIIILIVTIASFYDYVNKLKGVDESYHSSLLQQILLCFSFPRNLEKLVTIKPDKDGLTCIAGMKSITMGLIILGHGLMFEIGSPLQNPEFIEQMYSRVSAMLLLNGPIVVDTFFMISGFLTSYFMLLELRKRKRGLNVFLIYFHRVIRLTPPYMVVVFFYTSIFSKLGSGVFWNKRVVLEQERCRTSWWANLLYINNYVNKDQICMFQSWYLACEMHLFIIAVLLVLFLWKKPRTAVISIATLTIVSIIAVFISVYVYNEEAILLLYVEFLKDPVVNSTYKSIYTPSHLRLTPYLIGILVGYLRYKIKKHKYQFPTPLLCAGWIICTIIMFPTLLTGYVFYAPDVPKDIFFTALYSSMYHLTWSLSISWLIIAVSCGYGAYFNAVLSWNPNIILSRITYSTFLVHGVIQMFKAASVRSPQYTGYYILLYRSSGELCMSFIFGWALTMLVESPIIAIEKLIFKPHREKVTSSTENLDEQIIEKPDIMNPKFHVTTHM